MGNFLRDASGNIKIPSTKINLVIRPNTYQNEWQEIQTTVSSYIKKWEQAGFQFKFTPYEFRDEINTALQERFLEDIGMRNQNFNAAGVSSATPRNMLEEFHDFTIDLGSSNDAAFMLSLTPNPFTKVEHSTRVSIGSKRSNILQADVVHEVGHALGFAHEHQRIDRDSYVTKRDNYQQAFDSGQQVGRDNNFIPFGSYDTASVMHYPGLFNDKNTGKGIGVDASGNTSFPNQPSDDDILAARFLYNEARIQAAIETCFSDKKPQAPHYSSLQTVRLNALNSNIGSSIDVAQRTYNAVKSQKKQLSTLNLDINTLDESLLAWAEKQIDQIQQLAEETSRETARHRTNSSKFYQPSRSSRKRERPREQTFVESITDSCHIS